MRCRTFSATLINSYSPMSEKSIKFPIIKIIQTSTLALLLSTMIGCGTMGAAVSNGPTCPYQGLSWDFAVMTDWKMIKNSFGLNTFLGALDTPFSFVADTLSLPFTDWSEQDLSDCPRHFD